MINIKYGNACYGHTAEMNIDIVKFVENLKMNDVIYLCKKNNSDFV